MSVKNTRISRVKTLITPTQLAIDLPLPESLEQKMETQRSAVASILNGTDSRMLAIVGPCSVHDPAALLDYATRLKPIADELADRVLVVLRVYFEKPRTIGGWKGLINDPNLDGSFEINRGLHMARKLLVDVLELGLPAATEFLDTTFGQYYADLISFGAIGARTVESQIHRELASGLSMPVGFKNGTSGDMQVAVDAIRAAALPHWFPSLNEDGTPAVMESTGNEDCHLILRGGSQSGPNYGIEALRSAAAKLAEHNLNAGVIVDCSHANSHKDFRRQIEVIDSLIASIEETRPYMRGVMIESHLVEGRQDLVDGKAEVYGQSITDACLSIEDTEEVLRKLVEACA